MIQRMFVTIDTKKTNYKNVGKINHGDDLILELTVLSDGDMISFNDPMVDLLVKKSDGKMIRQNSGIEHIKPNKFVIEVGKDCVTSPGLSTNQLIINDNGRISTCMFYYTILNSLEEDIIESISNVEVLEQLDEFVIQIKDKMEIFDDELLNKISDFEDAIEDLEEFFGDTSVELLEAELSRNEAEQSRVQAESVRVQNETRRLQNDLDLANAEAERVRAENIRIQNEVDRALVDAVMDQKESEREDSELERIQNESKRATDEVARQQNENTRQSNESIRMINETDRKTQENRRATAETNRVNAETTRRNNENSRISNETERQKTMNEMKSLINNINGVIDERVGVIEDEIKEINSSLDNLESEVNELKEGNIQIDLTNYATKDYVEDAINNAKLEGGDVQVDLSSYAKKTDLHEHSNKTILDSITTSKVNQWDNKSDFSGDYNDLTNKPTIPTKTSQLTNDSNFITSNYVDDALGNAGVTPVYSILKDAKWVVIGDSISDTVDGRTRTDKFYQEFIAENTGCTLVNWNGNGTGYKTEFNGKSYIYNRLDEIPSDANLITIFSGTNDNITLGNYGDTGFDTFYGVVDETVKAIKDKFPLVPLGLITPLPRTSSDLSNTKNKGYSEAIKAIGKKYSVPVLDLYADCGFHVNNNEFKLNCLPDGLHPNINGHAMLSKKIQPWLENVVLTDEYTKYVIRGMGILSASSLGFTSGGTKEFTIALDRVPNENQGIVLQSTNTSVTISPSTIYFNKTAEAKTITLTIPSTVTTSFTINAICNNINIGSITFSNGGTSSGEETDITLSSITATYTQGSTVVYPSTSLDSLKNNLVVKANYSDNSQTTLTSTDYSLSGTLTVGTSTITVTYSEKTTTFIVNVTEEQQEGDISNLEYYVNLDFTNSLNSTSSIANLANSSKNASIASNSSPTWGDGYLSITGGSGITVPNLELTGILEFSYELDCELTNSSLSPTLAYLYGQKGDNNFIVYEQSKVLASPRAYDDGANTYITNIRGNVDKSIRNKITVTYKPSEIKLYANGNLLATATDTTSNYSIKHILVCSSSFTGKIYGFKVYKKCLTNSEILALQNSNNSFD